MTLFLKNFGMSFLERGASPKGKEKNMGSGAINVLLIGDIHNGGSLSTQFWTRETDRQTEAETETVTDRERDRDRGKSDLSDSAVANCSHIWNHSLYLVGLTLMSSAD